MKKEFIYNSSANYSPDKPGQYAAKFEEKTNLNIVKQSIIVSSNGESFYISFENIFDKYLLFNEKSNEITKRFQTNPFMFWQNQLNFAIWCATTGCGVDYNNHLKSKGLVGSMFLFHVYYQTRRILSELEVRLSHNKNWNPVNNNYNKESYDRLCREFKVDPNTIWTQRQPNIVLLRTSLYSFMEEKILNGWTTFILDNSDGFTKAGVERINESIRIYCWSILSSQAQTRTSIIGIGTAFDAQKQFSSNVIDAINRPSDLQTQISNYQSTLKYARSKVNFVYGAGLYMTPADMKLRIGKIVNYNNEIIIAKKDQNIGINDDVNNIPISHSLPPSPIKKPLPPPSIKKTIQPSTKKPIQSPTEKQTYVNQEVIEHNDNKIAIIVGSIVTIFILKFIL